MTDQPEALRLADAIDPRNEDDLYWRDRESAAAELRRLHAKCDVLLNALNDIQKYADPVIAALARVAIKVAEKTA